MRAATAAGLSEIPAVVRYLDDVAARRIALLENLQREDLNEFESTIAIVEVLALHLNQPPESIPPLLRQLFNRSTRQSKRIDIDTDNNVIISTDSPNTSDPTALKPEIEQIFQRLSMTWQSFVTNRLPLLKLPSDIQQALREGRIAYTKAKVIAKIKDETERLQLLADVIAQDLSLSDITARMTTDKTKEKLPIQQRLDTTYRQIRKAKIWENPRKQRRLEALLQELDLLLTE